jgi:cytochrome bd ubiquinol oxidase subunit I
MADLDAALLSRIQFAYTMAFHIVFPAFTIGLASYLAVLEGLWLITGRGDFMVLYRFWLRIFALSFGMGVVSGIVMSYQFGTNWGPFADATGPILGPLMGYEVMTAFFLEAGFLGVMLFGMERVGKGVHFAATCLVALGTLISTFWIIAANSWMHTPQGFGIKNGQFVPEDWLAIVFNPSFPYRLVHMVLAAYLTTAFVVGAVGAYHLLRDNRSEPARIMFSMALWMILATAPMQAVAGDLHGLNTLAHQPAKIAAMEGHWETQRGAPLILLGMPDMSEERTRVLLEVPRLGSLILAHDWDGEVPGLTAWPPDERPYAPLVFWSFRLMVGIGLAMIALALTGLYLRSRGRLATAHWFHWLAMLMGPSGFVAVIAGWTTTEAGRQPWLVYGAMRTVDGRSPIAIEGVIGSFAAFLIVYIVVFGAGFYYILRLMRTGPDTGAAGRLTLERAANVPARPIVGERSR